MLNSLSKTKEELYIKHIGIFQNVETDRIYDECMAKHERTAYGSRSENIERIDRLDTNRFGTSSGHLIRNLELYLGHKLLISYVSYYMI